MMIRRGTGISWDAYYSCLTALLYVKITTGRSVVRVSPPCQQLHMQQTVAVETYHAGWRALWREIRIDVWYDVISEIEQVHCWTIVAAVSGEKDPRQKLCIYNNGSVVLSL